MRHGELVIAEHEKCANIKAALSKTAKKFGFDNASIGTRESPISPTFVVSTLPQEWIEFYMKKQLYLNDPRVDLAMMSDSPLDWATLKAFDKNSLYETYDLKGHGNNGVSIPFHSPTGASTVLIASKHSSPDEWNLHLKKHLNEMVDEMESLHEISCMVHGYNSDVSLYSLTNNQILILRYLAAGYTVKQTGEKMSRSARTIEKNLAGIREKLRVKTTAQAMVRATGLGLIGPV